MIGVVVALLILCGLFACGFFKKKNPEDEDDDLEELDMEDLAPAFGEEAFGGFDEAVTGAEAGTNVGE